MQIINNIILLLISFIIIGSGAIGCEGPAGPEGPQGEAGAQGDQGPQGEDGPGARVINISLENHVQDAILEPSFVYNSPQADTGAITWAAVFDTTIKSVAVADSEFVLFYANLPEIGFKQLPVNVEYIDTDNVVTLNEQLDNYSPFSQKFVIFTSILSEPVQSFGDTSQTVYGGLFSNDGYFNITTTASNSEVSAHTIITSSLGLDLSTEYAQQLRTDGGTTFPLDSELSNATVDSYSATDTNGELFYENTTGQVSALKDSLGSDLDLFGVHWDIFKASDQSDFHSLTLRKNPIERNVQLAAHWSPDSIYIAGYMEGFNLGNDRAAYIKNYPLEIRVVIVSGNIQGQNPNIPYDQIELAL